VLGNIPAGLVSDVILLLKSDQRSDLDLEIWNADGTIMLIGNRGAPDGRKGRFLWSVRYQLPPDGPYECKDDEDCKGDIFWWSGIGVKKGDEEQININGPKATDGHLLHSYQVRVYCAEGEPPRGEPVCNGELRFTHKSLAIFWGYTRGPDDEKIEAEVTFKQFDGQYKKTVTTDKDGMFIAVIPEGKYYLELKPFNLGYEPSTRDPRLEIAYYELEGGQTFFRGIINIDKVISCVGVGNTAMGRIIVPGEAHTVHQIEPDAKVLKDNNWRLENATLTLNVDERPFVEHDLLLKDSVQNRVVVGPGAIFCEDRSCSGIYRGRGGEDKIIYSGTKAHPEWIKIEGPVKNRYDALVVLRKKDKDSYEGKYQVRYQCEVKK
jgi:hypothetical protein